MNRWEHFTWVKIAENQLHREGIWEGLVANSATWTSQWPGCEKRTLVVVEIEEYSWVKSSSQISPSVDGIRAKCFVPWLLHLLPDQLSLTDSEVNFLYFILNKLQQKPTAWGISQPPGRMPLYEQAARLYCSHLPEFFQVQTSQVNQPTVVFHSRQSLLHMPARVVLGQNSF